MLGEALRGELVGIAFAALYRVESRSLVDATGDALRRPIFARGLAAELSDLLGELARGGHD